MKVLHKNNKKKWIWGTCSRAGTTTSSWRGYIKCQQPLGSPVLKSFSVKLRTKYTIPLSVPLQPRTAAQNHRTAPRRIAGCCHVAHFGSPRRNGTAFCQLLKRNKRLKDGAETNMQTVMTSYLGFHPLCAQDKLPTQLHTQCSTV